MPQKDIYDIGAHVGLSTLKFSRILKKKEKLLNSIKPEDMGRVLAFEPTEYTYKNLLINTSLNFNNQHSEILTYKYAISNLTFDKEIYQSKNEYFLHKSNTFEKNKIILENPDFFTKKLVPCKKLDDVFRENLSKKISLIKIDIGGHEFHALNGAKEILKLSKPSIVFEFSKDNLSTQNFDIRKFNFLYEFKYKTYIIYRDDGSLREFCDFDDLNEFSSNLFKEILCIPEGLFFIR